MFKKAVYLFIILFSAILTSVKATDLPYKEGELLIRFAPKQKGQLRTLSEKQSFLKSNLGNGMHCTGIIRAI